MRPPSGVLCGVGQQVGDHLHQPLVVALHRGCIRRKVQGKVMPPGPHQGTNLLYRVHDDLADVLRRLLQLDQAAGDT